MPMDEVIRAIEQTGSENMQDLMDAVIRRYQQLYPAHSIMFLALPLNDSEERKRQLEIVWNLLRQFDT